MKKLATLIIASAILSFQFFAQQSTTSYRRPNNVHSGIIKRKSTDAKIISGVPAYIWQNGCGPTALGMVVGYYDKRGFEDLIIGDASTQTKDVNDAIACKKHYEDYSLPLDFHPKILPDKSATENTNKENCIADFMKTSWSKENNYWGWSWASHVNQAFENYVYIKNDQYVIHTHFERINNDNINKAWKNYKIEIDNNRPVILLVDTNGDKISDHFVTAIGYDAKDSLYGVYDTWDKNIHWYKLRTMSSKWAWGIYSMHFFKIAFHISVNANISNIGIIEGDGEYNYKETAYLTAEPKTGYEFINWTEDGNVVSISPNYNFVVLKNRNLTANFRPITAIDIKDNADIMLYPNPANNHLNISTTEIFDLTIFDMSGKKIVEISDFDEGKIDVSSFNKGLYLVVLSNQESFFTRKLIIQ